MKRYSVLFFLLLVFAGVRADIRLPSVFTDGMVLQQKADVAIWGKSGAGKTVTITTSWNQKAYTVKPDQIGNWRLNISTPEAGGPYEVRLDDGSAIVIRDILIASIFSPT